jgi:quinohemoprotein ethanol dehydrogenase
MLGIHVGRMVSAGAVSAVLLLIATGAPAAPPPTPAAGDVSQARVLAAGDNVSNWLVQGRTFEDQRFSPAKIIDQANVKSLGLAWYRDIPTLDGLVAAPIVVDGVVYISAPMSKVYALDLRTGGVKWTYDPEVKLDAANYMVSFGARYNRGVAVWEHKVIVGTADCRLIALDANTGRLIWDVVSCDHARDYYKTGAPRVGGGMVFSGSAGAEAGARGFVDAYDVSNGKRLWRFYTVPKVSGPQESEALERALPTWQGAKEIGGGTVWEAITYDPELDLLYFGTSHGKDEAPNHHLTGIDHLYLESIVAVKARTGEYVWHRQITSQATFHIMLANLTFAGVSHKVLMTAPNNGYFYVLERATGKPLRIGSLTKVNWASKMDPETAYPTWNPKALTENMSPGSCFTIYPGGWGAHNWHAMSYSPLEKLVYLPVTNIGNKTCRGKDGSVTTRMISEDGRPVGDLVAWDPVLAKVRWRLARNIPYNGGTLATGGGLAFEGTGDGLFQAVAADTGRLLWSQGVGSPILGAPVTVVLDDEQYVLVAAGNSGSMATYFPHLTTTDATRIGPARMLAFKLGGQAQLPTAVQSTRTIPKPPDSSLNAAQIARGKQLYDEIHCAYCHGDEADNGRHSVPNLLYMSKERHDQWDGIVIGGVLRQYGMLPFPITLEQSHDIHAYVISRQHKAYEESSQARPSAAEESGTFGGW